MADERNQKFPTVSDVFTVHLENKKVVLVFFLEEAILGPMPLCLPLCLQVLYPLEAELCISKSYLAKHGQTKPNQAKEW